MFKLGLLPHGTVTPPTPDVTPNFVEFAGVYADNTTGSPNFQYRAQQITGINQPIALELIHDLDSTIGFMYYQIANSWPYGDPFASYIGPTSSAYGTFYPINSSFVCPGCPVNPPTLITINPNQWLILAIGNTSVTSTTATNIFITGLVVNVSDSNTVLYTFTGIPDNTYYHLEKNIANPTTIEFGPTYDDNISPSVYFYSSSNKIECAVGLDAELIFSYDPTFDTYGQLYYITGGAIPSESGTWSDVDPNTLGYIPVNSGSIITVTSGKTITFAVGGKVTGSVSTQIDLLNNFNSSLVTSFIATAIIV